jgi:peptidoglycan/xylan/chitin deacetylase (PgdA/CDA1 family)
MTGDLPDLPLLLADVPTSLWQALAQEGVPSAAYVPGSRAGRFVLFDSTRLQPVLSAGQTAINIDPLRRQGEGDPFRLLADERSRRCSWQIGGLSVDERVARVDRAPVRARLIARLRQAVEAAGGLWLRVAPFPFPYRTAFNFRLDHDDYDAGDFRSTLDALAGHEPCVSHYVCASTHARQPDALRRLRDSHVGSHGWWHHTYRGERENFENIRRGIDALRAAGLNPRGFAAPHGRFNRGLLAALESLGVDHSSEFGLAHDDLPFFPGSDAVLQLPIHPICLGLFLEAARRDAPDELQELQAARTTLDHFQRVAVDKHAAGEPIFLYGHPAGRLGRYPFVLRETLEYAASLDRVWRTSLDEFARWWRARAAIKLSATRRGGGVEITTVAADCRYEPAVELYRGDQVLGFRLANGEATLIDNAAASSETIPAPCDYPLRQPRRESLRAGLRLYLDYECETPLAELTAQTWQGWAKRTLRRIRA